MPRRLDLPTTIVVRSRYAALRMRMTVLRVRMTDYALAMHMASKHKLKLNVDKATDEEEVWIPLEPDDYKCEHCAQEFNTISALHAHYTWCKWTPKKFRNT